MSLATLILAAGSCLSGCATVPLDQLSPAVLASADEASLQQVKATIAQMMKKSVIKLGTNDYANSSTISVLPDRLTAPAGAPFTQHDFALPIQFDIMSDGANCYIVKQGTDDYMPLDGVACRAL